MTEAMLMQWTKIIKGYEVGAIDEQEAKDAIIDILRQASMQALIDLRGKD